MSVTQTPENDSQVTRPSAVETYAPLLGRTQGLRGSSEIMAGARAELAPSPITTALSSLGGRVTARTVINLGLHKSAVNFFAARMAVFTEIILKLLRDKPQPLMVDLASGYSPLGFQIAQELPHAQVKEIDLAQVQQEKRKRLQKGRVEMPPNLELVDTNLGEQPLHHVLRGHPADVISYTGIYFTPQEQVMVARYLRDNLSTDGACVCITQWKEGQRQIREATRFFRSQTGETPGIWEHETAAAKIFRDAGFSSVQVIFPSQIGEKLGATLPIMDVELIVVARN
ncbi:MAG: class I SAM-dependent methyltransferase [Anaerolineae bacterium]